MESSQPVSDDEQRRGRVPLLIVVQFESRLRGTMSALLSCWWGRRQWSC